MTIPREGQAGLRTTHTRNADAHSASYRMGADGVAGGATTLALGALTRALPGRAPARSVRPNFRELRAALSDGWEIVQPIFARPLWSIPDDSATAFNFVLRRAAMTRLVTVPDGRTVQRFIRDQHLKVDYRRSW